MTIRNSLTINRNEYHLGGNSCVGFLSTGLLFNRSSFTLQFAPQFLLAGQLQLVAAGEYLPVLVTKDVANHCIVLVRAENQANGGVVILDADLAIIVVDIHLHLAESP